MFLCSTELVIVILHKYLRKVNFLIDYRIATSSLMAIKVFLERQLIEITFLLSTIFLSRI